MSLKYQSATITSALQQSWRPLFLQSAVTVCWRVEASRVVHPLPNPVGAAYRLMPVSVRGGGLY